MATHSLKTDVFNFNVVDGVYLLPSFSVECFQSALRYDAKADDIFIVTYPKCGTTWMQYVVINILRKAEPLAKPRDFFLASPFLDQLGAEESESLMIRPGAFKTHLSFCKVPWCEKAKYIYVARNPKDCALSYFHHMRQLPMYRFQNGDINVFLEHFLRGEVEFNDYFDHLLSWYNQRHRENVFFTTFEKMKADLPRVILNVAEFLGDHHLKFLEENQGVYQQIIKNCDINNMRNEINPVINEVYNLNSELITVDMMIPTGRRHFLEYISFIGVKPKQKIQFVRTGNIGNWKTEFSAIQNEKFEQRIKEKTGESDMMKLWEF